MRRALHPWGWLLLALAVVTVVPAIDLAASAAFYVPGTGFPWREEPLGLFVRRVVPRLIVGSFVVCATIWAWGLVRRRTFFTLTTPRMAYLAGTLLVGPGLIVETVLKPNWGRVRPDGLTDFGGTFPYAPPLLIAEGCTRNCSFVSGHAAVAFWLTAYAFLLPPRHRRIGMALALIVGAAVGAMRVMQGAHFLSDVLYAGAIVAGVNALAFHFMLAPRQETAEMPA